MIDDTHFHTCLHFLCVVVWPSAAVVSLASYSFRVSDDEGRELLKDPLGHVIFCFSPLQVAPLTRRNRVRRC